MKAKQHKSQNAVCPYYHKHSGTQVYCAGLPEAVSTQITFTFAQERKQYMTARCESEEWLRCPLAQTLERIDDEQ